MRGAPVNPAAPKIFHHVVECAPRRGRSSGSRVFERIRRHPDGRERRGRILVPDVGSFGMRGDPPAEHIELLFERRNHPWCVVGFREQLRKTSIAASQRCLDEVVVWILGRSHFPEPHRFAIGGHSAGEIISASPRPAYRREREGEIEFP